MRLLLRLVKLGCLAVFVLAGGALWLLWGVVVPVDREGSRGPEVIEIPAGASGAEVARILRDKALISSELAFRLLLRATDRARALKAGHHRLDPGRSPLQLLEDLLEGEPLHREATFPEGLTVRQVAELLERREICRASEFLELAQGRGGEVSPDLPGQLEGYLFPDTYRFPWVTSARVAASQMTARFQEVVRPLWSERAPLNLKDTVILASLVEREAQVPAERPLIAGVYLNRLRRGMLLQCDATVQYALGDPKAVLTYRDLEIDSPYNTYRRPGLPPGPICSPGRASIEAALRPRSSEYLFYVRDDVKGDGSHVFTRSYAEHERAIQRVQR